MHGDFGVSATTEQPIAPEIGRRLEVTAPLALLSLVLALALALPTGVLAALRHRRLSGTVISAASQVGIAIPEFWAGILLITIVSVRLGWLPAGSFPGWGESVGGSLEHLILPVIALALVQAAVLVRFVRSAVLEVLREDFMRTARAGGLTRAAALRRHGLRNASTSIVTLLGLQVAGLLVGAVVIERVFNLPGLGLGLLNGIDDRDTLLVQDIVMLLTAAVLVVNLGVDLSYRVLDPRLRGAAEMNELLLAESAPRPRARRRTTGSLIAGAVLVASIVLTALISYVWTPYDPTVVRPDASLAGSSWQHLLGADQFGHDTVSQLMVGARTTLWVGLVAIGIAALDRHPARRRRRAAGRRCRRGRDARLRHRLRVPRGADRDHARGRVRQVDHDGDDRDRHRVHPRVRTAHARVPRLQVLRSDYVLAARACGRRPREILTRHVLPNIAAILIVQATVLFAVAILAEAALSYLGLGTSPPTPTWGGMLTNSQTYLDQDASLALWPGLAIALAVLGFSLLGDGLRDVLDPRLRRR